MRFSKFKKYVLYATGEIILVVTGILIALYVNNKNQESHIEKESIELLKVLKSNIQKDIFEINQIISEYDMIEMSIAKVTLTPDDEIVSDCEDCLQLIYYFSFPEVSGRTIYNLDKIKVADDGLNRTLTDLEIDYTSFIKVSDLYIDYSRELIDRNMRQLLEDHDWFRNYLNNGVCNNECQDYISSSMDFRNRVAYIDLIIYNAYQYDMFEHRAKLCKHLNSLEVFTEY